MSEARASGRRANQGRVGTTVNGKWHIDARIGSGGMATVYAATHRNGRRVALKMLHTQLSRDEATRARFLREGYVANAVGHAGVVHVEDDGVSEDGSAFLVLDLLEGDNIEARRLQASGKLPIDEVLEIADQALDALAAAHEKGIIHRDVKPDNVFLCHDGRVMLLDFGLAQMKSSQSEDTKTGVTIGTPAFMPPEQAQGRREEVDARSDVWGLGATLFTAITGEYVHDAETLQEQLIASATIRPRGIRELAPHVSASVAVVIDRSLELDKADRWESAREMQRALRAARSPRTESDRFLVESLTLPAASLRRTSAGEAPPSGPRPSGAGAPGALGALSALEGLPVPSSDATVKMAPPPSSDQTIEAPPPRTAQMLLDGLPSSGGPASPPPTTERLKGAMSGAVLQAQSQHAQREAQAIEANLARTGPHTPQLLHLQQQMRRQSAVPAVDPQRTLASPAGPFLASAPPSPTLASATGSGPYAAIPGSGANTPGSGPMISSSIVRAAGEPGVTPRGSGSLLPEGTPQGGVPHYGGAAGAPQAMPYPTNGSTRPSAPPAAAPGAVVVAPRSSARAVVLVSFVLILICGAMGAWVLLHR